MEGYQVYDLGTGAYATKGYTSGPISLKFALTGPNECLIAFPWVNGA
jgi:hypothetical protein